MKESIGSTASLNIIFAFLAIIFAFLAGTLSYYKAYKVNNIIVNSIEKFEGLNDLSINEINIALSNLGYQRYKSDCDDNITYKEVLYNLDSKEDKVVDGICVYINEGDKQDQYLVVSYMTINLPIVSEFLKFPVRTATDTIYRCYSSFCQ